MRIFSRLWTAFAAILFSFAIAALFVCCKESQRSRKESVPRQQSPIPENVNPSVFKEHHTPSAYSPKSKRQLLKGSVVTRFATPSQVRFILDFDGPVTHIQWSPLKGFSVTAGNEVHNVTSRGQRRWRVVAGEGHRVYGMGELELVWSPAFGRLSQLRRRGLTGWTREWEGRVAGDKDGVYLFDASTVAALGDDGKDKWRVALEGIREVDGPFACKTGMLVHGMSGMKRVSVEISMRGGKRRVAKLGRGGRLVGAGPYCEPLVWREGELKLLGTRGYAVWRRAYVSQPFVTRLDGGFALVSGRDGRPAMFEVVTDDGRTTAKGVLPVAGRITRADAFSSVGVGLCAIGLCLDVTHPCAAPGSNRGPYNALVTPDGTGGFRPLIRHTAGHLGVLQLDDGGLLTASTKDGVNTDLVRRDSSENVVWQLTLPGRLSAEPYIGPYGAVYIGTCSGWACKKPYRLFSVTISEPESEDD